MNKYCAGSRWNMSYSGVKRTWIQHKSIYALGNNRIINVVDVTNVSGPLITDSVKLEYDGQDLAACGSTLAVSTQGMSKQSPGFVSSLLFCHVLIAIF